MLQVAFPRVRPKKVGLLRAWMAELNDRRDEVLETFEAKNTRHEQVFLLDADGAPEPVMVYVMEVDDPQQAAAAFAESRLPVDVRHQEVMAEVDAGRAEVESLLDIQAPAKPRRSRGASQSSPRPETAVLLRGLDRRYLCHVCLGCRP